MSFKLMPFHSIDPSASVDCDFRIEKNKYIHARWQCKGFPSDDFNTYQGKGNYLNRKLYEDSCCELFLSNGKEYIELNFDLSGGWNSYQFDDYRKARESPNDPISPEFLSVSPSQNGGCLEVQVDLQAICKRLGSEANLVHCTAILRRQDTLHFFASSHPQQKPDFHDHDFFITI